MDVRGLFKGDTAEYMNAVAKAFEASGLDI
jgi:hypothetical protein